MVIRHCERVWPFTCILPTHQWTEKRSATVMEICWFCRNKAVWIFKLSSASEWQIPIFCQVVQHTIIIRHLVCLVDKLSISTSVRLSADDLSVIRMMVRPGELCVIQRGMKFKVRFLALSQKWIIISFYRLLFLMALHEDVSSQSIEVLALSWLCDTQMYKKSLEATLPYRSLDLSVEMVSLTQETLRHPLLPSMLTRTHGILSTSGSRSSLHLFDLFNGNKGWLVNYTSAIKNIRLLTLWRGMESR